MAPLPPASPETYEILISQCLEMYRSSQNLTVIDMSVRLMDNEEVPINHSLHHFIVPAVLLTAAMKAAGYTHQELEPDLREAMNRSIQVLGGFCGSHGNCGAAVGMGIFTSIMTGTTTLSQKTWAWSNEATGIALLEISRIAGPRCCKRTTFITLKCAVPFIQDKMNITLPAIKQISCSYHNRNQECKKYNCPFYPLSAQQGKNS